MAKTILARYSNGSLTPVSPVALDLPEGEMVRLTVEAAPQTSKEGHKRMANSRRLSTNEWLEKVRKRKEKSRTRVTAEQILAARDADRR